MRLDSYLVEKKFFETRTKAKQSIERGEISVNGKICNKPSFDVRLDGVEIKLVSNNLFVSVGAFKLEKALSDFSFSVENLVVGDIGASTGGFTECLIKHGAKKVYAVDLNDELLHGSIKNNEKVVPIIKNAKELVKSDFNDNLDLITVDLSFISLTKVLPAFYNVLETGKYVIALIKPQFEIDEKKKFKNGIIKDFSIHKSVCKKIYDFSVSIGFSPISLTIAPINKDKNREFLILLKKGDGVVFDFDSINFSKL